jgi:hypothetical protein
VRNIELCVKKCREYQRLPWKIKERDKSLKNQRKF